MAYGIIAFMKWKMTPLITSFLFGLLFLTSACTGQTQLMLTPTGDVFLPATPTQTASLTPTHNKTEQPTKTPTTLPSPTPTPRVHEVKRGETLGGIAWSYGVSLDALLALNPEVNVRAMSVGTKLLIPYQTVTPANQTPVPTAVMMPLNGLNCVSVSDGGIWCFMTVENIGDSVIESISVNVNIADLEANQVFARTGFAPLNLLRPGDSMPVGVYFPPTMPAPFQYSAQFVSAIPVDDPGSRYVSVTLSEVKTVINPDGSFASVSGKIGLADSGSQLRVVAAAYDAEGLLIGLRRWQLEEAQKQTGEFNFQVYAVEGIIDRVEVLAEAQR